MKDEKPLPRSRQHHHEEHAPTVIHDPTADETVLMRWMRQALERGPVVWIGAGVAVVLACLLWIVLSSIGGGRSASSGAWESLMLARDAEDRAKVAEKTAGPVASWALLQAGQAKYQEAFTNLPANRDAALPLLTQANDLFKQALDKAPPDSVQRRLALLGMARALEARGDLDGAVQRYQEVAKGWPGTDDGREAKARAEELRTPEAIAFYQKFSAYKAPEISLPPGGTSSFDLPGGLPGFPGLPGGLPTLPPGHPDLSAPTTPAPPLVPPSAPAPEPAPTPAPEPAPTPAEKSATPAGGLPAQPFAPTEPAKPSQP